MYFSSLKLKFFRTILNMYSMTNIIITCAGGGPMTTNGDFWGLMGTKNHGD